MKQIVFWFSVEIPHVIEKKSRSLTCNLREYLNTIASTKRIARDKTEKVFLQTLTLPSVLWPKLPSTLRGRNSKPTDACILYLSLETREQPLLTCFYFFKFGIRDDRYMTYTLLNKHWMTLLSARSTLKVTGRVTHPLDHIVTISHLNIFLSSRKWSVQADTIFRLLLSLVKFEVVLDSIVLANWITGYLSYLCGNNLL